jgi:2-phosphosulfolactate phosphatase
MVAIGEDHGLRPDGFDLPNSPVEVAAADLRGRSVVQRTSAGTRGVVAAQSAKKAVLRQLGVLGDGCGGERQGLDLDAEATARSIVTSDEARRALALGLGHVHPDDIAFAARVDAFDFAMEVRRIDAHLVLRTTQPRR